MFVVPGLGTGIKELDAGGMFCYGVCVFWILVWFFGCLGGFFLRGNFTVPFLDQLFSFLQEIVISHSIRKC